MPGLNRVPSELVYLPWNPLWAKKLSSSQDPSVCHLVATADLANTLWTHSNRIWPYPDHSLSLWCSCIYFCKDIFTVQLFVNDLFIPYSRIYEEGSITLYSRSGSADWDMYIFIWDLSNLVDFSFNKTQFKSQPMSCSKPSLCSENNIRSRIHAPFAELL